MSERQLLRLPLSQIDCEPQVRSDMGEAELAGLAQSFATVGLQQPILVRPAGDRYVIVDGERRFRASQQAGLKEIEALVEDAIPTEPERILKQLVANVQRKALSPIETARALDQLIKQGGYAAGEAASKLGFSAPRCSKFLSLLTLPEEIQRLVHTGRLAASTAYEIAKTKDPKRRARLIAKALRGALKRDAAAAGARGPRPRRPRVLIPVGKGRMLAVTGPDLGVAVLIELIEAAAARLRTVDPHLVGDELQEALRPKNSEPSADSRRQGARGRQPAEHLSDADVAGEE